MIDVKKYQFIIIFIFVYILLGIFPFSIYLFSKYSAAINKRDQYVILQKEILEQLEYRIIQIHERVIKDLNYIVESYLFKKYLLGEVSIEDIEQEWLLLSLLKRDYDQIRYLDKNGMEKIRVNYNNGNPYSVPKDKLQNKSNRYYFKDLLDVEGQSVLISKFDLNIENGEIEDPIKPMLRYSLSIYRDEEFLGAIILNFLAQKILEITKDEALLHNNNLYFLNSDGYFLSCPNSFQCWGFMYESKKDSTIFNMESLPNDLNKEIIEHNKRIYTTRKIFLTKNNGYPIIQKEDYWTLMTGSLEPNLFYDNILIRIFSSIKIVVITYLFLSVIISYTFSYLIHRVITLSENRGVLQEIVNEVVNVLEVTSNLDDDDTGNHIRRVCEFSYILAKSYGLSESFACQIKDYASLHDIGKVGVHDSILKKTSPLTQEEWEEMKMHVEYGKDVIKKTKLSSIAYNIVYYHHENWDGTGYLSGLNGEEIPLEARIVTLADVYDALRSKRCYKPAHSHDEAMQIIISENGKKFDPKIITAFIYIEDKFSEIYEKLK